MSKSAIEWTDETWNPVTGCDKISLGCKNCYAEVMAKRCKAMGLDKYANAFDLTLHPECLGEPLKWKKPRMCFVCSMSDLCHCDVPNEFIAAVWGVMAACPSTIFQVLTKRAERLPEFFEWYRAQTTTWMWGSSCGVDYGVTNTWMHRYGLWAPSTLKNAPVEPLGNVWVGVSVENRKHGLPRIEHLRRTPAAVRFLSIEPLLEDLGDDWSLDGIDWVIVGGESGPGARPMHPDWVRRIRDKVLAARMTCQRCKGTGWQGVHMESLGSPRRCDPCNGRGWTGPALFFKQWGAWRPARDGDTYTTARGAAGRPPAYILSADGTSHCFHNSGVIRGAPMLRVGKGKAGRELEGRTWDEMPVVSR